MPSFLNADSVLYARARVSNIQAAFAAFDFGTVGLKRRGKCRAVDQLTGLANSLLLMTRATLGKSANK